VGSLVTLQIKNENNVLNKISQSLKLKDAVRKSPRKTGGSKNSKNTPEIPSTIVVPVSKGEAAPPKSRATRSVTQSAEHVKRDNEEATKIKLQKDIRQKSANNEGELMWIVWEENANGD
jgi:hypothetical protein